MNKRNKKVWEFRLSNGRRVFALLDCKKWFIECSTRELPAEVKKRIKESMEDAAILKRLVG